MPRVVAAPDKFRGTATAAEVAGAVVDAADGLGWEVVPVAMSDGGEGLLDAFATTCPGVVVTQVTEAGHPVGREDEQIGVVPAGHREGVPEPAPRRGKHGDGVVDLDVPGQADPGGVGR